MRWENQPCKSQCMFKFIPDIENINYPTVGWVCQLLAPLEKLLNQIYLVYQ